MTTDNNQPIDDQPVSPHQRVLKVAPQVHYGRPNPQLMRIHADDVQGTLPPGRIAGGARRRIGRIQPRAGSLP